MRTKKVFRGIVTLAVMMCMSLGISYVSAIGDTPSVKYSFHVQDKGWMSYVSDGAAGGYSWTVYEG